MSKKPRRSPPPPSPSLPSLSLSKQVDLIFMAGNDPARAGAAAAAAASSHQWPSVIGREGGAAERDGGGADGRTLPWLTFTLRYFVGSEWRNRLRRSWQLTERRKEGTKAQKRSGKRIIIFDEAELKRPTTRRRRRPPARDRADGLSRSTCMHNVAAGVPATLIRMLLLEITLHYEGATDH